MVIFLIGSERERKKGASVVASAWVPRKCPMPPTAVDFSRHSTTYEWQCLQRHETCWHFGLFILKCIFILFSWLKKMVPFCWSTLICAGSKYNTFSVWVSLGLCPEGSQGKGEVCFTLSQVCLSLQFLSEKELHGNENPLEKHPSRIFAFSVFLVHFFPKKWFQHLVLPGPEQIALQPK